MSSVDLPPDRLTLQQIEEIRRNSVVMTVSTAARRVTQVIGPREGRLISISELAALVILCQNLFLIFFRVTVNKTRATTSAVCRLCMHYLTIWREKVSIIFDLLL